MEGVLDWWFEHPVFFYLSFPFIVFGFALILAWSIYLIGTLNIPFESVCRLWPPGWKCP